MRVALLPDLFPSANQDAVFIDKALYGFKLGDLETAYFRPALLA